MTSAEISRFTWPAAGRFANRAGDLEAVSRWWDSPTRDALCLLGRRRVGKSWLVRRFAEGKIAVVLVADRVLVATQMQRFADQLAPLAGVAPALPDLPTLVRVLYQLGRSRKLLAVIDEFPYLLPEGRPRTQVLSEIQAVMEEERDGSRTKLVLCGSMIGQMETLLAQDSPLHGRLQRLDVWPMTFAEARHMMPSEPAADLVTRYAVAGGMARYLAELGEARPLRELICERVLDRRGPLFNDPRSVLEHELRSPTYFSILEELSERSAQVDHLSRRLGLASKALSPYLDVLESMRLISAALPVGSDTTARTRRYRIDDGFIRFWFRFVFPNQDNLESGLDPSALWDGDIATHLSDHVAAAFEDLCVRWTRTEYGRHAQTVGAWWGSALNAERRAGTRLSEEVDVVGAQRRRLRIVGECKWTNAPMDLAALTELCSFKIPAIAQEGRLGVPASGPQILLFSKSGFTQDLVHAANGDALVRLVDLDTVVGTASEEGN